MKAEKAARTVDISDSDDENPAITPVDENPLDSRSFWKAGSSYAPAPNFNFNLKAVSNEQVEHARVHPKFLHSNATSHKWAFGAIAELLDNAVDEIHNGATFVKVDKLDVMKDNSPALLFQDDGGGMDPQSLRKCMSLGYSSKKAQTTIGQYGNGFKTSTMRLGADAIVFSRARRENQATQSVGLLSYTFLRKTGQEDVIVPMIDFDINSHWAVPIIYSSQSDWSSNLKTILEWSPFASKEELLHQFETIGDHGTRIIIYNLWLNDEGIYELNFDDDEEDICLRDEVSSGSATKLRGKDVMLQSHVSYRLRYSLRAYASVLYLRKFTNFNIILRGKPVEQFIIADNLKHWEVVTYRPHSATISKEDTTEIKIGFIKEAPALNAVTGFNVYHKNRLIRPFWKVTAEGSSRGNCTVGVLEANFIQPAHDKQDFERSSLFIRFQNKLRQLILDYWNSHCNLLGYQTPGSKSQNIQKNQRPANLQMQLPANSMVDLSDRELESYEGKAVEEICEENIQLFRKCEEHKKKEGELKEMIVGLEKTLEEEQMKCSQLALILENTKKRLT